MQDAGTRGLRNEWKGQSRLLGSAFNSRSGDEKHGHGVRAGLHGVEEEPITPRQRSLLRLRVFVWLNLGGAADRRIVTLNDKANCRISDHC